MGTTRPPEASDILLTWKPLPLLCEDRDGRRGDCDEVIWKTGAFGFSVEDDGGEDLK
jgi:hypothetical protein